MLTSIPEFNEEGNLPQGIHISSWIEFKERFGHNYYRRRLIKGLYNALQNLKNAGCLVAYIDGSFVTNKRKPRDYDGCWEQDGVDPDSLDPALKDFGSNRTAQKIKFLGEMFPASMHTGSITMLDFFQTDKNRCPKGIILINLGDLE